ncbi:hypothetical protein CPB85DRAFT_1372327 [Mucidula mucida]|nr:hypothetical protein CPB85DRAFT_1372327 [Mucidula mucida]
MVHILGIKLNDGQRARFALTEFYGVGHHVAHRLCARFQIHDQAKVGELTPFQITSLASFLSSPQTAPPLPKYPLATRYYVPPPPSTPLQKLQADFREKKAERDAEKAKQAAKIGVQKLPQRDPLNNLKIESELKREIRENIMHHRSIGTWRGKRHGMGLPVRGQRTRTNAKTAKKLNHISRFS